MQPSNKSTFRAALMSNSCIAIAKMFMTECIFNHTSGPLALYVDLLYFIHMPPPASASTYLEFAVHLWNIAIKTYRVGEQILQSTFGTNKPTVA